MQTVHELIDKLNKEHALKKEEWVFLLGHRTEEDAEYLFSCARKQQQKYFGNCVYMRGLIEFTNICRNDCYYCGIRKSNPNAERYRLTTEQILSCAKSGYELGFRTFVLQGGEDLAYKDEDIVCLVRTLKEAYPDCAVTLSIGKKVTRAIRNILTRGQTVICCAMRPRTRSITGNCIRRNFP